MTMYKARYAAALVPLCELIVGAVHDDGPDILRDALDRARAVEAPPDVDPNDALITIIAAMVDPNKRTSELLGWVKGLREVPVAAAHISCGQVSVEDAA